MTPLNPQPYVDVLRAELTAARHAAGLTQYELAPMIGCAQPTLSAWESGLFMPGVDSLIRWADVLGLDVALIGRVEARAARIAQINAQLEDFLNEPLELQRDVIRYLRHTRPETYRRLQEFLRGSDG